uniref:competence type IV pilus ATPase ComGA n=1 Tax=uncultured Allobacillus sp. TaxID=1638025 RepID=UPI00259203A6|nr:competence type IV pilus ATPase ComGA [uncultured Allobacillus sp.]
MKQPEVLSKTILMDATTYLATDIHFSPGPNECHIYFRINGYRWFYKKIPRKQYQSLLSYYKFRSGMDIAENRLPQDGTLSSQVNDNTYFLRLSTLPLKDTESLAIRVLPEQYEPNIEELFVFSSQAKQLMKWLKSSSGIILFTGPTGSGKSSTMYALLKQATKEYGYQSITLEDPIEQSVEKILQVQVNEKSGFDYDVGLKAALRHDPDVIMVGEIRDDQTAKFAIRAALTGHLVLSTIHARNTFGTLTRLKQMGIPPSDLHESIIGIVAQQLVELSPAYKEVSHTSRSAIAELLSGQALKRAIDGISPNNSKEFLSLDRIRRKAHAEGIIQIKSEKKA